MSPVLLKKKVSLYVLPEITLQISISTLLTIPSTVVNKFNPINLDNLTQEDQNNLEWFCGFSEAEANFYISTTANLTIRIKLHIDDLNTLIFIQQMLSKLANRKIGLVRVLASENACILQISTIRDIIEVIIPILTKFYFTTTKYLDFKDWESAALIRKSALNENRAALTISEKKAILTLKSQMNNSRVDFNTSLLPKRSLTAYRLLGFLEGDASLCLPNLLPAIVFKQHFKNIHFLNEISVFLQNLPYNPEIGPGFDTLDTRPKPGISNTTGKARNTSVVSLTVGNILQIYNYILPFLKSLNFKTRKSVDFLLWEATIKIKALGYHTLPRGWRYLVEISNCINNKRYSTNLNNLAEIHNKIPDITEIGIFFI